MGLTIGSLHVRRSILCEAPRARVWAEFESFDRISAWLNLGHTLHTFEPRVGGQVRMSVEYGGEQRFYGGSVLILDPEREVSFESQWDAPHGWAVPTFWTIRLTPNYDATLVEIFHHGFERLGADAANNLQDFEDGWDIKHLKALRAIAES
jgi:uncharacterized protein YndB with AHSA1/START domain